MRKKYFQIYRELVDKIRAGDFPNQARLPSEHDLMSRFSSSRETVRKALKMLEQNGLIQKVQGKGSIVLDVGNSDFPVTGLISFKELAISKSIGEKHRTHVEELELVYPTQTIQQNLNITKDEQVWKVHRVREIDGERVILDKDYFNQHFVTHLTKEICENSIYDYIEYELGMKISYSKKEMTIVKSTDEDQRLLHLNGSTNIVIVRNFVYFEDASLFQYTESRLRPDKFKFVYFARRISE